MSDKNDGKLNKNDPRKDDKSFAPEKQRALSDADGLGLEDALDIAYGAKSRKKTDGEIQSEYIVDIGESSPPKKFDYIPTDSLSGKKAIKASFDVTDNTKKVLSPSEQYADITAKVLKDQNATKLQADGKADNVNVSNAKAESGKSGGLTATEQKEEKKAKARILRETKKAYSPAMRAHADYDTEGDVNGAIAKNESYLIEVQNSRRKKRIIALIVLLIFLVFLLTFGISVIVSRTTGFTVNMNGGDAQKGLTLYDNAELKGGTSQLVTSNMPECDNQTYSELVDYAINVVDKGDGQQSKKFWFFAYSFYVQNISKGEIDYDFSLSITTASKGLDDAIRVMLIDDSDIYLSPDNKRNMQIYAKPKCDPVTGKWMYEQDNKPIMQKLYDHSGQLYPENKQDNPTPFYDYGMPIKKSVKKFSYKSGRNLRKYTVLIYIEGGDEDCTNALKGGGIKFRADLAVTDYRLEV